MKDEKIYAILRTGWVTGQAPLEGPMTLAEANAIAIEDETAFILRLTPVDCHGGSIEEEFRSGGCWPACE